MDDRAMRILKHIKSVFSGRESGAAFIAVLTFLILGAIIIGPLLGFMITGLRAQQSHEGRTTELYSADAGVEYAVWQLQNGGLLSDEGAAAFTGTTYLDPFEVNGDNVTVSIQNENDEGIYFKIVSEATDMATGSMTRVRARVTPTYGYQGNFFENGITGLDDVDMYGTCNGDVECAGVLTVAPDQVIMGDVRCYELYNKGTVYGNVHCEILDNRSVIYGDVRYYTLESLGTVIGTATVAPPPDFGDLDDIWPEVEYLTSFYLGQVPSSNYPYSEVNACSAIGPLYTGYTSKGAARSLTIDTKTQACEVKLDGTIFVTGDFTVTSKTLVNLNGQSIYCLGDIYFAPGSYVKGSGVIIGVGTVRFQPTIVAGGTDGLAAIVHYNGGTWSLQASPATSDLKDVWGYSDADVYAVGEGGTILVTANAGTTWTTVTSGTASTLNGVWGTGADDIFTVGNGGTILHYDGSAWGTMSGGTTASLNAVWGSASDNVVYAVGDGGTILRYTEDAWFPMTSFTDVQLNGVWGTSGSNVYAVGADGTIRRYDGNAAGTWAGVTIGASGTTVALRDVWGSSATDIFFVGDEGTSWRYKDGSWIPMTIDTGIHADIMGVWGAGSSSVFAVGELGAIMRFQGIGSVWTQMASPSTKDLNGVWGSSSSNIFAVGRNKEDFIFVQSVSEWVELKPNGEFHGSMAGSGVVELYSGSSLMAPGDLGRVNFPRYRWMNMESYIIEQH